MPRALLLISSLSLIRCAEIASDAARPPQLHCMIHLTGVDLFSDLPDGLDFLKLSNTESAPNDPCSWVGVTCAAGHVTQVAWDYHQFLQRIDLRWTPGTVERLHVIEQRFRLPFDIRLLPGRLRQLSIITSSLKGTVDMLAVPPQLAELSLPHNELHGAIRLSRALPQTLIMLDFGWNKISVLTVDNAALPASIMNIRMCGQRGSMEVVCVEGELDGRVQLQARPGEADE